MKKPLVSFLSTVIFVLILVFPGCGGGSKNTGNAGIKIYEVNPGGVAHMSDLNRNGVVFADSLTEIGTEYILFLANNTEGVTPGIQACYKDTKGKIVDIPVSIAKNGDCFVTDDLTNLAGGGTSFSLVGVAPGGRGEFVANANGSTKKVDIYVFDSYGTLGATNGVSLNNTTGIQKLEPNENRSKCIVFSDLDGLKIVGKSYFVADCTVYDWKEKLKAIKDIDTVSVDNGVADTVLNGNFPKIYVAENPLGGYIKVVRVGTSTIWEYALPGATSFK